MHAGVDEAGRGPVLGPLVIAAVHADPDTLPSGIADSKTLPPDTRERLAHKIRTLGNVETAHIIVDAAELNERMQQGETLDTIETDAFVRLLRSLEPQRAVVDTVGNDPARFEKRLSQRLPDTCSIQAQAQADVHDPVVAAASILAKTMRDACMQRIEDEAGQPLGSGYPSDPTTRAFLEAYRERSPDPPPFARKAWKTLDAFGFGTRRLEEYHSPGGSP